MHDKLRVLEAIFGHSKQQGDEHLFMCPNCSHRNPKLSISIQKNVFKCWLDCGLVGNSIIGLIYRFGTKNQIVEWKSLGPDVKLEDFTNLFVEKHREEEKPLRLPIEFVSLCSDKLDENARRPLEYLIDRNITENDIYKWKIGFCPTGDYRNRIIIPSYSSNGKLNYFVGRDYSNRANYPYWNSKRSKNIVFNDLGINWSRPVTIVEGVFDAMKCDNAVPILGKTLMSSSVLFEKILENKNPVYIGLDIDAEDASARIINKLTDYGVEVRKIEINPYKDLGEMPKEEIKLRKETARRIENRTDYLKFLICSKL